MSLVDATTKRCGKCKKIKATDNFGKVKGKVRSYCRPCHASLNNKADTRTEKTCACCNELKPTSYFSALGKRFQPYCKECSNENSRRRHEKSRADGTATAIHREYYWRKKKWVKLRNVYGISKDEYESMKDKQGNVCAICFRAETQTSMGIALELAVDHDHTTGKIRGLLCRRCNQAIGMFKEEVDVMRQAIVYLEHHKTSEV